MPLPPHRRRHYAYLLVMHACVVVMLGAVLVELDEPSDSDTSTSSSDSDTSTESPDSISTICPPARKRKRIDAPKSDENAKQSITSYQEASLLPARKRVKTSGGDSKKAIIQAEETGLPSKRRLRRMTHQKFETDIAESIIAISEAIKAREGWNKSWDRFDEWSSKLTKVLLESTDHYKSCLARLENGYDLEARWQALGDSFGFERTLKLCETRDGDGHVEEWVEAVAKSRVLRSRRLEPRKLSALE